MAPRALSISPSCSAISQCGRRSSRGSGSPQRANRDVRLLAADRHVGIRRVRDAQHRVVELGLDGRPARRRCRRCAPPTRVEAALSSATSSPFGSAPARTASPTLRLASLRSALSVSPSASRSRRRPSSSSARSTTAGILALVGGRATEEVGFVAQPLEADAHASTPTSAASRRRRITNSRSSAASSHPARGPDGRPRKAT